ncbi:MAG: winged helix-turn-helix domain-containing protein [Actinomycetota bacterium]|nr:winged helix-turn-helix domain-containing protein [Actinomycetota bacterium]
MSRPSPHPGVERGDDAGNGGTRVVSWPADRAELAALQGSSVPRLVVVDDGSDPPVSADCRQDWMWRSGGEREMRLRLQQLSLRALEHRHAKPELDELGMLRVGLRSVHLPAKEQALAALLLREFGRPVLRDELIRAAWPEGITRPNVLATRMAALRSRLVWLGLEVQGSSATGYCLRPTATVENGDAGGFEDELAAVEE